MKDALEAAALGLAGTMMYASSPGGRRARITILIYHRVLAEPDPLFPGEVDAARFDAQLGWLRKICNVLRLDEAIERLQSSALPARAAAITFDDGYADNAEVALPLLRKHGLSATFFISTGFIDGGRMWNDTIIESLRRAKGAELDLRDVGLPQYSLATTADRRRAIDDLIRIHKYMSPEERAERVDAVRAAAAVPLPDNLMLTRRSIRALHAAGMGIGAHTVLHPILARLDAKTAQREMAEGRDALESLIGTRVSLFAYPNGKPGTDYTAEHVRLARALGFTAAFSTAWGAVRRESDVYQLPRFTPWDRTAGGFALRLVRNLRLTPQQLPI